MWDNQTLQRLSHKQWISVAKKQRIIFQLKGMCNYRDQFQVSDKQDNSMYFYKSIKKCPCMYLFY